MLLKFKEVIDWVISEPGFKGIRSLMARSFVSFVQQKLYQFKIMSNQSLIISVHQLFESQVVTAPDSTAVVFKDQKLTYRELNQRSNQVAHYLGVLKPSTEALVGVCLERSLDLLIVLLGILKAGAAYVPLDPNHPKERLALIMSDAQMLILLTQEHLVAALPQSETQLMPLEQIWDEISEQPIDNPPSLKTGENLAYVMYTSGSTGKPKGVQIQHGSVVNFLQSMRDDRPGLTSEDVVLALTTITFDISVLELFLPLAAGACVVIAPQDTTTDGVQLSQALEHHGITVMQATPATWQMLIQAEWQGSPNLKVLSGGEPLPRELANQLQACCREIWNMYGPTETTIWSTCHPVTAGEGAISIGYPIANTQVYILNEQLHPLPVGEIGELYIGGAGLARGYNNRPELTTERFITNPFDPVGKDRIYRTGDLARVLRDGSLECLGRVDHQVKIRGFRIELGEIEALLWQHPDVQSAVVMAREDVPGHKRLVGYVMSRLMPDRIPYQSMAAVEIDGHFSLKLTTDLSNQGIGLVGTPSSWKPGQLLRLQVTLPGILGRRQLQGKVAWCQGKQAGIQFLLTPAEAQMMQGSFDHLLEAQGLSNLLQRSLVGNLREYLKNRLPDYMVPSNLVVLNAFPLTPNGKVDRKQLPAPEQQRAETEKAWVAPRNPIEQEVARIWQEVLDWEQIGIHDTFRNLAGNSLQTVQMLTEVNKTFQTNLPLIDFLKDPTISGLAKAIQTWDQSEVISVSIPDWSVKTQLDPAIVPMLDAIEPVPEIFLTGATGFLGAYLLAELLQQTRADVYCLVRAKNCAEGQAKLQNTLKHYHLWSDDWSLRILPVLGDLGEPHLGLDLEQFSRLAEKIDMIYHCGAWVNILYPYAALEAVNVTGTQEILRLASQTKVKPVHFISTVDVFAHHHQTDLQTVSELDPIGPGEDLYRGYAQSKFVAEKLVMAAQTRGIPVAIYRPSNVMGASGTGIGQNSGFIAKMIKGCLQMGSAPDLHAALNLVPVDYASRAIVQLALTQPMQGQVFHIVNPEPLMWQDCVQWIGQMGYSLKTLSYDAWLMELADESSTSNPENPLVPLANLFTHRDFIQKSLGAFYYKLDNVIQGLVGTRITCPIMSQHLLNTYFAQFIRSGFLEYPANRPERLRSKLLPLSEHNVILQTDFQNPSCLAETCIVASIAS